MADGTENLEGQAAIAEPGEVAGEPNEPVVKTDGQPDGVKEPSEKETTTPNWERDYKELQREFGKRSEALKAYEEKLGRYGGVDKVNEWVQYLSENPRFAEWVKQEQERNVLGTKEPVDEETRKALDTVRAIAQQETQRLLQEAFKNQVEPLAESYKSRLLEETFSQMDKKYEGWRDLQDSMAELAESLPMEKQDNPSIDDLEDLYFKALRRSGKLEDMMAKSYQKKLTEMKQKSTEKPASSAPAAVPQQFKSIAAAFEYAKKQAGLR